MGERKDGGPAFCSRCGIRATHYQGHQWLCPMHYRFGQMRANAKRKGKDVPKEWELGEMSTLQGMLCADCGIKMNWLARENQTTVATLQHYRDGTMKLVCRSCNTRHTYMPGDSFRDMPMNHKWCPRCKTAKPFSAFSKDRGRSGPLKLKSWCLECSRESHREWRNKRVA